jgi:signal transduction histidine kinase
MEICRENRDGFRSQLPAVPCLPGEFNQVILNLVVNAAHAIADVVAKTARKGRHHGQHAAVAVTGWNPHPDTGTGIPEKIRGKILIRSSPRNRRQGHRPGPRDRAYGHGGPASGAVDF